MACAGACQLGKPPWSLQEQKQILKVNHDVLATTVSCTINGVCSSFPYAQVEADLQKMTQYGEESACKQSQPDLVA